MSDGGIGRRIQETFYRIAASGLVPRAWVAGPQPDLPAAAPPVEPPGRPLRLEIVSHCWQYHHLLHYQLSSLALHPPESTRVTMTVCYSPEDSRTVDVLGFFGGRKVPGVEWNWQPLDKERLFRRAIGRNLAARSTRADWIWFSDCDAIFHRWALDGAATVLRGRNDVLVFPREHRVTELLGANHPLLQDPTDTGQLELADIDPARFQPETREKAVGGFQIVRGDVARKVGYCRAIPFYQRPVPRWQKTYEDRTFRWLLGTHGTPVEIPGLYRIRHVEKGRKAG
ncbi:MAG: glycosyltransferase family 2 protein [Gemmatimonadota bacterium]